MEKLTKYFLEDIDPSNLQQNQSNIFVEFRDFEKSLLKAFTLHREKILAEDSLSNLALQTAHDIRSPAAALKIAVQELENVNNEPKKVIENVVNRIEAIANNLLHYNKNNKSEEKFKKLQSENIYTLIEEAICEKLIQHKNIDIKLSANDDAHKILCKIATIPFKTVISNLLNNSVEAITGNKGSILIHLSKSDDQIKIEIIDNGKGISEASLAKFNMGYFFSNKEYGNGIGLRSAISYIKSWNGSYYLDSEIGKGTKFVIYLPITN